MRKLTLAVLMVLLPLVAWAQPIVLSGDHQNHVLAGEGKDYVIEGHHLNVALTGRCGKVVVSGHHNDVVLEEPAVIDASGHHNDIVYQRGNPQILKGGAYNTILSSSGTSISSSSTSSSTQTLSENPDSANGININGSGVRRTEEGKGRLFSISGSGNEITIKGTATVIVSGSGNVVEVENPSAITVSGVGNAVFYKAGSPVILKSGVENRVEKR